MPEPKFKVGDLVMITERVSFYIDQLIASPGDVGIISRISVGEEFIAFWGIDYMVLINGKEFVFFEEELELYKNAVNKTSKKIKFVLLKK